MTRDRWLAAVLLCAVGQPAAAATEYGVASATIQDAPGGDGWNASLTWIGRYDTRIATIALDQSRVEASSWTVLRVGGTTFRSTRLSLSGTLDIGLLDIGGASSTYRKAVAESAWSMGDHWTIKGSDTFVDVAAQSGHLLGAAAVWHGSALLVQTQLAKAVAGTLDDESISLRVDYRGRPPFLLGGVAFGDSNDRLLLDIPSPGRGRDVREAFAGVVLRLRDAELTVVADMADIGRLRRNAITLSVSKPLEATE